MIHSTAEVSPEAEIGAGTKIWHQAQVREGAVIGKNCTLGKGVYVDHMVQVGSNVKLENGAQLFRGVTVEDGAFIGPGAILANDLYPRSVTPSGEIKSDSDWTPGRLVVQQGASVGAGAIILPGVTIGAWALVGAGAIVVEDVPVQSLAVGNPAHCIGHVCRCGQRLSRDGEAWSCAVCNERYFFKPEGSQ